MAEDNGQNQAIDLSGLGSFDFAPSWTAGDRVVAKTGHGGSRDQEEERTPREGRAPRRFDGPKPSGDRLSSKREFRQGKPFNRDGKGARQFGGAKPERRGFVKREFIKPLEAEIRVLPGQKDLGGIIRKIQTGGIAYPLKQIAWFFLDHPEACHVKVTPKDPQVKFHVCKACGFSCFSLSALEDDGIEPIDRFITKNLPCHTAAFAGASGIGKSTLLNRLFPHLSLSTSEISRKIERGRHTTRQVELFSLSEELDCGYIADTPGFSMLDFERFNFFEKEDLPETMREFVPYLGDCRYTKCSHTKEDGCAILEAVREGKIPPSRHASYLELYETLKNKKKWN